MKFKFDNILQNNNKSKPNSDNKLFFLILGMVCVFFSLPILFSYDSSIYIEYLDFFSGEMPWGYWGKTRGWGYPLFLWISSVLFGESAYGLLLSSFILFILYVYYVNKSLNQIELCCKYSTVILCVLIIINPIILGYYHFMLTEPLAATICIFIVYQILKYYKYTDIDKYQYLNNIIFVIVSCILLYFIKQMFFIIPILILFFSNCCLLLKKKISFIHFAASLCIIFFFLFISINYWNKFLNNESQSDMISKTDNTIFANVNVEGQDLFNAYLIKGAIYFKYDNNSQTIIALKNNEIIDIISYEGEINQFTYILSCFIHHPLLLLEGYLDGYGALANLYKIEVDPGMSVSSGKIIKDVSFIRGYENYSIGCFPRYYHYGLNTYEQMGRGDKLVQYGQYTDQNIVTKFLYSHKVILFYNFTFTFSLIYTPFAMKIGRAHV